MNSHFVYFMDTAPMHHTEKDKLALRGNDSKEASAKRVKAARFVTGLNQLQFGKAAGISKAAVSNIEKTLSFPTRPLMQFLFRDHRIDFNFMINGDYAQLPSDVQDALFEQLSNVHNGRDPTKR